MDIPISLAKDSRDTRRRWGHTIMFPLHIIPKPMVRLKLLISKSKTSCRRLRARQEGVGRNIYLMHCGHTGLPSKHHSK
jgi:hypothetical protein